MPTVPIPRGRWLLSCAVALTLLVGLMLAGGGPTFAQDAATPTATATPTETPTADATETPTSESVIQADVSAATTPDFAIGDSVQVADGPLNLRAAAGTDADVLLSLSTGARLQVTGSPETADGYTWFEVLTAAGDEGWVAGEFLTATDETPSFSAGDDVVVADGPLNVRDDGALDGAIVSQLETGAAATIVDGPVTADEYTWYQIDADDGVSGWVAGEFLSLAGPSDGTADFAIGDAVRAGVDEMNFRAEAGLDAEVLDTLDEGALFVVRGGPIAADGYTWYEVFNYYYGAGWVAGELMVSEPDGFPSESGA